MQPPPPPPRAPNNRDSIALLVKGTLAMAVLPLSALLIVQDALQARHVAQKWVDITAVASGVLAIQVVILWFGYAAYKLDQAADIAAAAEAKAKAKAKAAQAVSTDVAAVTPLEPIRVTGDVVLPECSLPTMSPRLLRQRSYVAGPGLASKSPSPHPSPQTSPQSPATKEARKSLSRRVSSFTLRGRSDGATSGRMRAESMGKGSPISSPTSISKKKIVPPPDAENMDVALRVSVAPWLMQDEALAKRRMSGFVDGCEVEVVAGEVVDHDDKDLKLRAQVAPWTVQLANLSDDEDLDEGKDDDDEGAEVIYSGDGSRARGGSFSALLKIASPSHSRKKIA